MPFPETPVLDWVFELTYKVVLLEGALLLGKQLVVLLCKYIV